METKEISTIDNNKPSTTNTTNNYEALNVETNGSRFQKRRRLIAAISAIVVIILILFVVGLVLALTLFKSRDPETSIVSATVDGVTPHVSFPIRIELNVTLDLEILVKNRNYASFRHGTGRSVLFYRGKPVGEAVIFPGSIPARGEAVVPCKLTLEVDELAGADLSALIGDVLDGEVEMESVTTIPGRVSILGIVKKHAVAVSECRFTVGLSDMKVRSQECKSKTKL